MICVPDLQHGIDTYTRLGFNVCPGGVHPGQGTHNAIAFHEEDYLELLSVRDRGEYLSSHPGGGFLAFLAQGGGFRYIAVQSDERGGEHAHHCTRQYLTGISQDAERTRPAWLQAFSTWRWIASPCGGTVALLWPGNNPYVSWLAPSLPFTLDNLVAVAFAH